MPHGASDRAPVVSVSHTHSIAEGIHEASPPKAQRELCHHQKKKIQNMIENKTTVANGKGHLPSDCPTLLKCATLFLVCESWVL